MAESRHWQPSTEAELAAMCIRLGAGSIGPVSAAERQLMASATDLGEGAIEPIQAAICAGADPLGDAFGSIRSAVVRRERGATYTPRHIVHAMIDWAVQQVSPVRVVEPGSGSARFLGRAGRVFPRADLIAIEIDPLAALVARANLAAAGFTGRAQVHLGDFRSFELPPVTGPTLFVGNPPYVRHHQIEPQWKEWLARTAASHQLPSSGLAGLHVHFFLATLIASQPGDVGTFISASEWLDVNYGKLVRDLLAGPLGVLRIDVVDPTVEPFADALTTAVITGFRVGGSAESVRLRKVEQLDELSPLQGGSSVARSRLAVCSRWTEIDRSRPIDSDLVELGELCRVHRGQVTGANSVWIARPDTPALPEHLLPKTVTRARELFAAGSALCSAEHLRSVIDVPANLDDLSADDRELVEQFLLWASEQGADQSYIARHRRPWWSVRLREPAPILASYMARRPPTFVRNPVGARHINIAHGLYPRETLPEQSLDELARYLNGSASTAGGRTYAGGLTKFEPREMERLWVPRPEVLAQLAKDSRAA